MPKVKGKDFGYGPKGKKAAKRYAEKHGKTVKHKSNPGYYAEDKNWIQGAEKSIERRGTEGKCTPITKPGCTGRAKALARTFKKMAKKRKSKKKVNSSTEYKRLGLYLAEAMGYRVDEIAFVPFVAGAGKLIAQTGASLLRGGLAGLKGLGTAAKTAASKTAQVGKTAASKAAQVGKAGGKLAKKKVTDVAKKKLTDMAQKKLAQEVQGEQPQAGQPQAPARRTRTATNGEEEEVEDEVEEYQEEGKIMNNYVKKLMEMCDTCVKAGEDARKAETNPNKKQIAYNKARREKEHELHGEKGETPKKTQARRNPRGAGGPGPGIGATTPRRPK